jgi:hypothetical protein
VGLVLALLVAVTSGSSEERADAAHAVLLWRSGNRGVTEATVATYLAALTVRRKIFSGPLHSHRGTGNWLVGCMLRDALLAGGRLSLQASDRHIYFCVPAGSVRGVARHEAPQAGDEGAG